MTDPLTHGVHEPFFARWTDRFTRPRCLQQGALQVYLLDLVAVAIAGLAWISWGSGTTP
jgi:hypothetical protein